MRSGADLAAHKHEVEDTCARCESGFSLNAKACQSPAVKVLSECVAFRFDRKYKPVVKL